MTASSNYIDLADLKSALRITNTSADVELNRAINSSSRLIDQYCNDQFWRTDPLARLFRAEFYDVLEVKSFADTAGVIIELDNDDDGVFETVLDDTDWQAEPVDRDPLTPFKRIQLLGGRTFPGSWRSAYQTDPAYLYSNVNPYFSRRARVRITAEWGWPSVPPQVIQACQILAISAFKSKDITGGFGGASALSTGAFGAKRDILINPSALDPMAIALLSGLRDVVVA